MLRRRVVGSRRGVLCRRGVLRGCAIGSCASRVRGGTGLFGVAGLLTVLVRLLLGFGPGVPVRDRILLYLSVFLPGTALIGSVLAIRGVAGVRGPGGPTVRATACGRRTV